MKRNGTLQNIEKNVWTLSAFASSSTLFALGAPPAATRGQWSRPPIDTRDEGGSLGFKWMKKVNKSNEPLLNSSFVVVLSMRIF